MYTVGSGLRLTKAVSMMASRIQIDWHSNISIFASERFLKSLSDEYGWIGGIDKSGKLKCVLPFAIIRKAVLRLVRFPVQTIFLEEKIEVEEEKVFLNNAVAYFRSIDVDVIIPATFNTVFRTYPKGAMVAPFGSYIIDLRQSEETLWNNIHSKHRNIFANPKDLPGSSFIDIPDYHGACIVATTTGTPIHKLKPGPRMIGEERVQLNPAPLKKYREALEEFVDCL